MFFYFFENLFTDEDFFFRNRVFILAYLDGGKINIDFVLKQFTSGSQTTLSKGESP